MEKDYQNKIREEEKEWQRAIWAEELKDEMYWIEEFKIEKEERDNEINMLKRKEELWRKKEEDENKKRVNDEKKRQISEKWRLDAED